MYIEIVSAKPERDGRASRLLRRCAGETEEKIGRLVLVDSYRFDLPDFPEGGETGLLCDPIAQRSWRNRRAALDPALSGWFLLVEIAYRPGVTNPEAVTLRNALESFMGKPIPLTTPVQTARQYLFYGTALKQRQNADGQAGVPASASADDPASCRAGGPVGGPARGETNAARGMTTGTDSPLSAEETDRLVGMLHNPLIERAVTAIPSDFSGGDPLPLYYPLAGGGGTPDVEWFHVASMSDARLETLSTRRLLALDGREMAALRDYFSDPAVIAERRRRGLPPEASDVELEMIAQTWSEHCKHKIFRARITYTEEAADDAAPAEGGASREGRAGGTDGTEVIESLFSTYIRDVTEKLRERKGFLRSVFDDNSGVIDFDGENLLCFKVETHNSPSALDPYGGAITGIVGVNRDILGTGMGARPIFNTDVLCFADPRTPREDCPPGLLHPRTIMEGVHRGIVDGGNQSGIPVVAGAFHFDDSYIGKPLVFCGTGGILPARIAGAPGWKKGILPGDRAVMVGGRIGKDGIHGATFSSLALDESSPVSAVQIGDPITQKNMSDFLMEARDLGLYRFITDNGAGGLSSSLGEMAQVSGGVRIDLSACPLKYQGLAPWEILVSESQERMSLAVPPESIAPLLALAARRGVETTEVGVFTDSGFMEILHAGKTVGLVSLKFLHEGNPRMELRAVWKQRGASYVESSGTAGRAAGDTTRAVGDDAHTARQNAGAARAAGHGKAAGSGKAAGGAPNRAAGAGPAGLPADSDGAAVRDLFRRVLSDPVVGSKEDLVRQYDHEVLGQSVIKPFAGVNADAPSDGGMIAPVYGSTRGATITHGLCPRYGDWDTRDMAICAVDEAYRAHIAMGGDPDLVSALDNFCWPDPVESPDNPDGPRKLAQLVRACRGLAEACLAYGIPLISGKDSMKNDAKAGGRKISVRPTLLVSLLGIIGDVRRAVSVDFKKPGDPIYLLGETRGELGGTICERVAGRDFGSCPSVKPDDALRLYRALHEAMRRSLVRSCHDLSDGGLAVALAESAIGGDIGATVDLSPFPEEWEAARVLFCETPSRFLATVSAEKSGEFEALMAGLPARKIGKVLADRELLFDRNGTTLFRCPLDDAAEWWRIEW